MEYMPQMTAADLQLNPDFFPVPEDIFQRKFSITEITGDGNCLFRALSMGVWKVQHRWKHLKDQLYKYAVKAWGLNEDPTEMGHAELPLVSTLSKQWTRFWSNEDRKEALSALKTDNAWGGYIHILLFESHYNYAVYVWLIPGTDIPKESPLHPLSDERMNNYTVYSKPSESRFDRKGFVHLLWDGISHYSFLTPNIALESRQRERGTLSHFQSSIHIQTPNKKDSHEVLDWDEPLYDQQIEDDSIYEMPTPDSKRSCGWNPAQGRIFLLPSLLLHEYLPPDHRTINGERGPLRTTYLTNVTSFSGKTEPIAAQKTVFSCRRQMRTWTFPLFCPKSSKTHVKCSITVVI